VIHAQPGYADHRGKTNVPFDEMYGPAHRIDFTPDGEFARLLGKTSTIVNSLHWQGLNRVADRLIVEGRAPDGVVEAVRVRDAGFALGAQWHPEFRVTENPDSMRLFEAFGKAARARAAARKGRTQAAA
jgi:putative glutamine amidotransferase